MAFWKPGSAKPGSSVDRVKDGEGADFQAAAQSTLGPSTGATGIQAQRERLPIYRHRTELLYLIEKHPVLIVIGQTGCGKTTQLPQYLFEAGWADEGKCIACTQPRRISAVSVASRVAEEAGSVLGNQVGYTIRFEDMTSPTGTRIKYMTDGMLFRECMRDPLLSRYSVVMVDEAHERGAYTDLLLGLLKKIRRKRPELRVIVSSATLDAQALLDFFNTSADDASACIVSLEGRTFPVEVCYLQHGTDDYLSTAIDVAWDIHLHEPKGDVLVFLTGREEIDTFLQRLADRSLTLPPGSPEMTLLPLHGGLAVDEQSALFRPVKPGARKVIAATNIAEASVTVDGVRFVVDCGFVKTRAYNPQTDMDLLATIPESRASAVQRTGRAGRTAPGKCFRLFPESAFASMAPATQPELARTDLSLALLQLKALGIANLVKFDWLPPAPPTPLVIRALDYLEALAAVDEHGRLTELGERIAELPTDAAIAKMLLVSHTFGCSAEALTIAAMTCVSSPFADDRARLPFSTAEGDHLTLLNVYTAFAGKQSSRWCSTHRLHFKVLSRAVSIRAQLSKFLKRFDLPVALTCGADDKLLRRCVTAGLFRNAAKALPDGSFRSARHGAVLHIDPSSVLATQAPRWVVFGDVVETADRRLMRDLTAIEEDWLLELAPHFYQAQQIGR